MSIVGWLLTPMLLLLAAKRAKLLQAVQRPRQASWHRSRLISASPPETLSAKLQ